MTFLFWLRRRRRNLLSRNMYDKKCLADHRVKSDHR
jgi:hypothetical protein